MGRTLLSPKLLREKGFAERLMFGDIYYVKSKIAVVYKFKWIPCTMEFGEPLCTNVYIDTWEELVDLAKNARIDI
jgi:hypothetical protein